MKNQGQIACSSASFVLVSLSSTALRRSVFCKLLIICIWFGQGEGLVVGIKLKHK